MNSRLEIEGSSARAGNWLQSEDGAIARWTDLTDCPCRQNEELETPGNTSSCLPDV